MKCLRFFTVLLPLLLLLGGCTAPKSTVGQSDAASTDTVSANEEATTEPEPTPTEPAPSLPISHREQFAPASEGIYNYCPTAIELPNGTRYIYYCTNRDGYQIKDYIGCRRGTPDADGNIAWGEELLVLSPSDTGWDSHHVCDPSVIAGSFSFAGESYGYLMAYLGCTSYDNQNNKIGIAVAKTPEGPFVRVSEAPLIDFSPDPSVDAFQWGVGQPSLINQDRSGHVLLFYTRGDKDGTRMMVDEWELSELSSPIRNASSELSRMWLYDLNRNNDFMNNADLAYDSEKKIYYSVSDCHPTPADTPSYISSHIRVNRFFEKDSFLQVLWREVAVFSPDDTGFARNHNAGLLRDPYGYLPQRDYLTVYYSVSESGENSLWSYRIRDAHIAK